MQVLIAPDKFRGSGTAREVATAVSAQLQTLNIATAVMPLADGGEGTVDAFGGANREATVTGPLGDPVVAGWRFDRDRDGNRAVIEMATASGLDLVGGADGNDPLGASTFGTGELISEAVDRGAKRLIIGLGGSATTDGGLGALRAMYPLGRYRGIEMLVATDVTTPFVDAARVFGPQKGATAAQIKLLTARLERLAGVYTEEYGRSIATLAGSGAAGGLAGGLAAIGAVLTPGFDCVADEVGLADAMETADLVITGEGKLDDTSFGGKVVGGVADLAAAAGIPVLVVAGAVDLSSAPPAHVSVLSVTDAFGLEASMANAPALAAELARDWVHANRVRGPGEQ